MIATAVEALGRDTAVRGREFDRLSEIVEALREGRGRTIELLGDPGAGKTWLLSLLARRAQRGGVTVLRSQCSEATAAEPFHTFIHAFTNWRAGGKIISGVADLISMLTTATPATDDARATHQLHSFTDLRAALGDCLTATSGGVLLLLDDFHLADPSSVRLLDMLLRRPPEGTLGLVVADRPRQVPVGLRRVLDEGAELGVVDSVELPPLTIEQSAALLGVSRPESGELERLHEDSEGNPLYLKELAAEDSGDARRFWERGSLGARILAEIDCLPERMRLVLEAAAVVGDAFNVGTVAAVAEVDYNTACHTLSELKRRDLVRPNPVEPGTLTFRHRLVRCRLHDAIDACRRVLLHRRALDHLSRTGASPVVLARHVERSGAGLWRPSDFAVLAAAAHNALSANRPTEAAHWVHTILRMHRSGVTRDGIDPLSPELWQPVIRAFVATGDSERIQALGRDVLCGLSGKTERERAEAVAFLAAVAAGLGHSDEAHTLLVGELDGTRTVNPQVRALLQVQLQLAKVLAGATPALADVEALAQYCVESDPLTSAGRLALLGLCRAHAGDIGGAAPPLRASARILDEMPTGTRAMPQWAACHMVLSWAESQLGWYGDSCVHAERALASAREDGGAHLLAPLLNTLGWAYYHVGRVADALAVSLEARTIAVGLGRADHVQLADALTTVAWAYLGRPTLAQAGGPPDALTRVVRPGTQLNALLFAEAMLTSGDFCKALTLLMPEGDVWRVSEPTAVHTAWYYELLAAACAQTGSETADRVDHWADCAAVAAATVDLPGQHARAMLARGHAHGHRRQWEEAARCYEEACRLFDGNPVEKRARELAHSARQNSLQDERHELTDLTMREREVADLAGRGLKTKDIAERLRISPRTVDVHLTRVYTKLGVKSRVALARLMAAADI